jgi:hypothetical protein
MVMFLFRVGEIESFYQFMIRGVENALLTRGRGILIVA